MSTAANSPSDLTAQLQREVEELRERVGRLERDTSVSHRSRRGSELPGRDETCCGPDHSLTGCASIEDRMLQLAEEVFSSSASIADGFDPDYPHQTWRVIRVAARGTPADLAARELAWHRKVVEEFGAQANDITIEVQPEAL